MTWNREDGVRGAGPASAGGTMEVACDESGSDGENLLAGNTDVFAHGSVRLSVESAAGCVREIRDRIRSPAVEYKANQLLREKHRAVLEWFLAPAGPIHGHAHVLLVEKAFFVVDRTVDLLLDDRSAALALFRAGPLVFGRERWREFLTASNQLLRVRGGGEPDESADGFFRAVDALGHTESPAEVSETLARLAAARPAADAYRARIAADGFSLIPVLNPLLSAVVMTAAHWSAGSESPVQLVHDRQNMLTPDRIDWITETARRSGAHFGGLRLVEARLDPRVMLADLLAGIARKISSDELNGHGDATLTALLRPYVGAASVWGDARSWARLGAPTGPAQRS
ncbi:hypothetical protein [Streptomyces fulvoviolaceus]|uniref:hypothetical protein n=1 Tax=Streptomyces fulvoviolaceus TaxID=285535 RepID=UPI0004CA7C69|nr:hypothetical protein [Streptomyces fulvoviolaceus]